MSVRCGACGGPRHARGDCPNPDTAFPLGAGGLLVRPPTRLHHVAEAWNWRRAVATADPRDALRRLEDLELRDARDEARLLLDALEAECERRAV